MHEKQRDICEKHGWSISVYDNEVELRQCSPAGEDFSFNVGMENFVENVKEYAAGFDLDEHIAMWITARQNGVSGIPST